MAQSKRSWRGSHLACLAALGLALATGAWASTPYGAPLIGATDSARVSLMVEPGAYDPAVGGVRLEWMFLVTETGNEVLSPYDVPQDLSASRT